MTTIINRNSVATPWGWAYDKGDTVAPGIIFYSTPSHGGYWLSPERRAEMPEPWRSYKTYAGGNWFEEDCDWAVVAVCFPDLFPPEALDAARRTIAEFKMAPGV